ncbi:hypothetical protein DL96DRAFT_1116151 [Flagelloscypha sp. PMI_526]|nr:hypothetical protein DL96DRAFT_1116151 [Flagelloscypha sp. PMI_526]
MTSAMEAIDFTAVNWQSSPNEDGLLWKPTSSTPFLAIETRWSIHLMLCSANLPVDDIYIDEEPLELLRLARNHKLLPSVADLAQYAHLDELDVETVSDDAMVLSDDERDADNVPALSDDETSSIASSGSAPATPDFGPSFTENVAMILEEPVDLNLDAGFDADDDDEEMEELPSNVSTPKARPHTTLP